MADAISAIAQESAPGALVTLFELDLTPLGGEVLYFSTSSRPDGSAPMRDGQAYTPVPIQATGFERSGQTSPARPKLSIPNVRSDATALILAYNGLLGAKLRRIRMFERSLDDGDSPDPDQCFPIEEYIVSRKSAHNRIFIEWELRAAIDLDNVIIPKRQLVRTCQWVYRVFNPATGDFTYNGTTRACPFTSDDGTGDYFDINDQPCARENDACSKRLTGCKARFGQTAALPFGGFPGAARVR